MDCVIYGVTACVCVCLCVWKHTACLCVSPSSPSGTVNIANFCSITLLLWPRCSTHPNAWLLCERLRFCSFLFPNEMWQKKREYFLYTTPPPLSVSVARAVRHRQTKHATPYHLMQGTIGAKCFAWHCLSASNFSPFHSDAFYLKTANSTHTHTPPE